MELKGKIIREEHFPYLVENGFDKTGILLWVDFGKYWKVILKTDYEKTERNYHATARQKTNLPGQFQKVVPGI